MTKAHWFSCVASAIVVCAAGGCTTRSADSLETLSEPERHARLVAAIRDAGYRCDRIIAAVKAEGGIVAWRIACSDALAYLASVEPGQSDIHVDPLAYSDPARVSPRPRTFPLDDFDLPRPPPRP
jgi:hypothetical protein